MEETEVFDFRVGGLVIYCNYQGDQEDYHKRMGIGIIKGWNRFHEKWIIHWPQMGYNSFEFSCFLRTIA